MKKIIIIGVIGILAVLLNAGENPPVIVKIGFATGNDFRDYNKGQQWAYAACFVNGVLTAPLFGASKQQTKWFEEYIVGMTDEQAAAIIRKYLEDNPGRWHESLNILSYAAMGSL